MQAGWLKQVVFWGEGGNGLFDLAGDGCRVDGG